MEKIYVSDLICAKDTYENTKQFFEENKIENIEFFIEPADEKHTVKLEKLLKNMKVKSLSFHGPYRYFALTVSAEKWEKIRADFYSAIEMTQKYNGEFLVLHTNEGLEKDADRKKLKETIEERIRELIKYADEKGVKIAVENVGVKTNMLYSEEEYINLIRENNYYSLIDIGHAVINGWDITKVIKELKDRIIGYHLHNNDGEKDLHMPVFNGKYDYKNFFETVTEEKLQGNLVLEYSADTDKKQLLEDLKNI